MGNSLDGIKKLNSEEIKKRIFACGANGYLTKPFDNDEINGYIDSILTQNKTIKTTKR